MENLFTELFFAGAETAGQPAPDKSGQTTSPFSLIGCLPFIALLGFFYAVIWRPQQKREKEHAKVVEEIKSGTKVLAAGMVGTITTVKKNSIILRSADSKVELDRNAIERILPAHAEDEEESK